ncbi:putative DNA metabolism protein [Flavobacterium araucananum]|uniref:DNA metabolism protein n=1 Tax=Flavobacterium araucananum TaxID=946678 RepID=A0A227NQI4_9FLAO|nr:TIGR03915 family putative DNA repair protein [Flavobacterium araucananum]OXE99982.1 DNA metabolism protein [Flavobacterium araucananum]PWJ97036.1 putative DNA metabolism protein [Flavobacterium araucananum]
MTQVIYDGTYEGWATAIFEIYEYKLQDVVFAKNEALTDLLFSTNHTVITDEVKVNRVLSGLKKRLSKNGFQGLYHAFLSDINKIEEIMFRYVQYVLSSSINIEDDFSNNDVLEMRKAIRLTGKEAHRMEAFVRFKLTKDQLYYAIVEPDCDVLPVIENHFKNRYADQRWLIYDARRKYGVYYDLENISTVNLQFDTNMASSKFLAEICDQEEELFQDLWRNYFKNVNIESRKNTKLHLQHMPKRYWKNLIEKIPVIKK